MKESSISHFIVKGKKLEVYNVTRLQSGNYTCAAANSEGANTSEPLRIRIKCKYALVQRYEINY